MRTARLEPAGTAWCGSAKWIANFTGTLPPRGLAAGRIMRNSAVVLRP
jgi:hypothetical protein